MEKHGGRHVAAKLAGAIGEEDIGRTAARDIFEREGLLVEQLLRGLELGLIPREKPPKDALQIL